MEATDVDNYVRISTHTLTWSVTISEEWKDLTEEISTHTLTWSVTCKDDTVRISGENFNSHAHVERDLRAEVGDRIRCHFNSHAHVERDQTENLHSLIGIISTHTLTWSVTIADIILIGVY